MPNLKFILIVVLLGVTSILSVLLENSAQAAGRSQMRPEKRESFDRQTILENIRQQDPEVIQMIQNMRDMQEEARGLAHEYGRQTAEEQKREIEQRLKLLVEEILRHQFVITERTLDHLAERYERLKNRHERNRERFDEIVEKRLRQLLSY